MEENNNKTGNVFLNKLKTSKIYQSVLGFVVVVILACLFSGDDYVAGVKGATFEIDSTRTLEQAFKDNPYIKTMNWEAVKFENGRVGVWVNCEMNADSLLNDMSDTPNILEAGIAGSIAMIATVITNASKVSYLFVYDESGENVQIDRVKFDFSKDKLQSEIERMKGRIDNKFKDENVKSSMKEVLSSQEMAIEFGKFRSQEIKEDRAVVEMFEDLYKKALPIKSLLRR
ncbi:MAG: hypothetical protein IJI37_05040 [Opitutales bacterium]|nr:hypothetical protein [Opitutales bacterium]